MLPKLYSSLAEWWPLLSPPEDYAEEAAIYREHLVRSGDSPCNTLLELGSGAGSNALHLKQFFTATLVDLSPEMLEHSRRLNPDCEHLEGDMRSVRLGRCFDRVFIHDAICYMTTLDDLTKAVTTAFEHCRVGGAALFAPDHIRETFQPGTEHGGRDGQDRSLRYLEWTWDPDDSDSTYLADYVYVLRGADGSVQVEHDRHVEGLFSKAEWLRTLSQVGFRATLTMFEHSEWDSLLPLFVGVRTPNRRRCEHR